MPVKVRLQEILDEKGVSQRKLAKEIGTRAATINRLCNEGVNTVYLDMLDKICEYLEIDIKELFIRVDE